MMMRAHAPSGMLERHRQRTVSSRGETVVSTHAHPTAAIVRMIARWLVRLSVWSLAAGVVLAISVVIILPRATQGFAMTVLTGSMTPEIPVGSVVLVRPVDPNTVSYTHLTLPTKA